MNVNRKGEPAGMQTVRLEIPPATINQLILVVAGLWLPIRL
jgi:hypothetical protein